MTQEARSDGSGTSGDPHRILVTLRPQEYGNGAPQKVRDPIIEPLWTGVRALAAVDDGGASLVDADGDRVEGMAVVVEALGASVQADGVILDGFLTKQTARAAS